MSDDLSGFSLMDLFRLEAETHGATISEGLLALEGAGENAPGMIEPLMRAAHSLKGAAKIVGLEDAVKLSHMLEDCFVSVQVGKCILQTRDIDILLSALDMLSRLAKISDCESLESAAGVDAIVADVQEIISRQGPELNAIATPIEPIPRTNKNEDLSGFSLTDLFRSEAETHLASLSTGLLTLEKSVGETTAIEAMIRSAHSLKGAARIVGIDAAVNVAHALEDCFVAVQEGKCTLGGADVDILLVAVDLLTKISNLAEDQFAPWSTENSSLVGGIVTNVHAIVKGNRKERSGELLPAAAAKVETIATPSKVEVATAIASESETMDRVVRVTANSLTRLMSLAGESLVQSRQLRPFVDSLLTLKSHHSALLTTLEAILERKSGSGEDHSAAEHGLLNRAKAQANQCVVTLGEKMEEFEDFARRNEDLSGRLHHEVLASRMRPLSDGIRGFPRLIRDIARQLQKQVTFEVAGENTGVDRDILEKLEAPLNHLIRNGLDHAIETPKERHAAGKPATGKIRLEARHRAGMLQITLSDDGRGIDPVKLRAKVVERSLATAAMAELMNEAELLEFLFLPGFSTKEKVTEISGRGVGLDVVQSMVRDVGGVVRVTSHLGQGTKFTLQLPITMSVVRALLVQIAGEPYAFPLNRIDRIVMLPRESILSLEGRQHFLMDEQPIGLVEACQVLDLKSEGRTSGLIPVVVASDRSHRFGVVVDAFLGERDLEVRPLDARLGKVPNINSASVLENGWPVLIFDVEDLVRSVDNLLSGRRLHRLSENSTQEKSGCPRRILIVDDSITVRELERQLLEAAGYAVDVAVDGLDGWNAARTGVYDLVVSDVDMPRMDGIQLVTLIKQDAVLRAIPVVIVSYKDREADRMRGLDAGANAYLTKSSFHDRTFLKTVVDLIGEARE